MEPEEQLEYMISMHQLGEGPSHVVSEEVSSRLAVVEFIDRLRQIEAPPEFAARLKEDIRSHIPSTITKKRTVQAQSPLRTRAKRPTPFPGHHFAIRPTWIVTLGIAALLLLAYATLITDFTQNLPGSPLSKQKQSMQQLSLTAQQDQKAIISQLYSALADLSTAVNTGQNDNEIEQQLQIVIARTKESHALAEVSPTPAGNDLNRALKNEEATLHGLLLHVDWSIQLAFTQQLGTLGDTIPTITNVTVSPPSNGTVLVTLSGTGFALQSKLVIDGQVEGTVTRSTSTQLIASVNQANWSYKVHAIGIASLDGMANQFIVNESNNNDNHSGSDDDIHKTPTHVAQATQTTLPTNR